MRLADALCIWERNTGRKSVMIVRERDFQFRALSGKTTIPDDMKDSEIMGLIGMLPDNQEIQPTKKTSSHSCDCKLPIYSGGVCIHCNAPK